MVATELDSNSSALPRRALIVIGVLFAAELALIGTVFKHGIDFTCLDNWPPQACKSASGTLVALYCILGALLLFAMLRPRPLTRLVERAGTRRWPLALNLAGLGIAMVPVLLLQDGGGTSGIGLVFALWTLGMALLMAGVGLFIAPAPRWRRFLADQGSLLVPMLAAAAVLPSLASQIRPLWNIEAIASATFSAVAWTVRIAGYDVESYTQAKVIGADGFFIDVAPQCSGIEGLALVTLFVTIYLLVFRADLRFPRALWLYPIGLTASAIFNVIRISVLLIIGLEGNPDLAVGGFHSHAGWLMFTLVALGIVALAQSATILQKAAAAGPAPAAPSAPPEPFLRDPNVARILPFAVFMFSALLAQVFANTPGLVYPLRALAIAAILFAVWPALASRIAWRPDPVALGAGALIGLAWVLIPYDVVDASPPYGALTGLLLVGWLLARGIGTVLLVPLVEEFFFRDYLEGRLRPLAGPIPAALVTATLFAALHDRWAEAFVAGLIFSWVMRRHGRVSDAILAHGIANLIVFAVALATRQMHII